MNRRLLLKIIWTSVNVALLISTICLVDTTDLGSDWLVPIWLLMAVLSFPLGLTAFIIFFALVWARAEFLNYRPAPDLYFQLELTFLWLLNFVAGYYQWFYLIFPKNTDESQENGNNLVDVKAQSNNSFNASGD
jgi:hypothetical protein